MFVVVVHFESKPEHRDDFYEALFNQARNSLNYERECVQFDVCVDPENENCFLLYEIYTSEEAFQRHLQTDHFKSFDEQTKEQITSKSVSTWQKLN